MTSRCYFGKMNSILGSVVPLAMFEMLFLLFGVCSIYFSVTFVWVSVLLILDTPLTMGFTFVPDNIIAFVGDDTTCRTLIYHIDVLPLYTKEPLLMKLESVP